MFDQHSQKKISLLSTHPDWELFVDLDEWLKFPDHIVRKQLRPDRISVSIVTKQVIMWELTVSWEENMAESYERMLTKCQELVEQCKRKR